MPIRSGAPRLWIDPETGRLLPSGEGVGSMDLPIEPIPASPAAPTYEPVQSQPESGAPLAPIVEAEPQPQEPEPQQDWYNQQPVGSWYGTTDYGEPEYQPEPATDVASMVEQGLAGIEARGGPLLPSANVALDRAVQGAQGVASGFQAAQDWLAETPVGQAWRSVSEPFAGEATRQLYTEGLQQLPDLPQTRAVREELFNRATMTPQDVYEQAPIPFVTGLAQEAVNPLTYLGPAEALGAGRAAVRGVARAGRVAGQTIEENVPDLAQAARRLATEERGSALVNPLGAADEPTIPPSVAEPPVPPPTGAPPAAGGPDLPPELPEPPKLPPDSPEGAKERLFAQSVREAPDTAPAVREALEADPGSYYVPISNQATANAATDLITADLPRARSLVYDSKDAPDAMTSAVGQILVKQAQDGGDFDEAVRLTETLAARATEAGQFIQALSMYGRLEPDGVLRLAQRTVKAAQDAGHTGVKLTPEKAEQIVAKARRIKQPEQTPAVQKARAATAIKSVKEKTQAQLVVIEKARQVGRTARSQTAVKTIKASIEKKAPIKYNDFMRDMRKFLTAEVGGFRLMRTAEFEMPAEDAARFFQKAQDIAASGKSPAQKQADKEALLKEIEDFRDAAVSEENLRRKAADLLTKWEARQARIAEQAQAENERMAGRAIERQASAQEATGRAAQRQAGREAQAELGAGEREIERGLLRGEKSRQSLEAQQARAMERQNLEAAEQVEYLTDAEARVARKMVLDREQVLTRKIRAFVRSGQVETPEDLALHFLDVRGQLRTASERETALLTAELLRDVAELVPVPFWRKVATLQTMSQLLNIKTFVRNLGGNALFAGLENVTRLLAVGIDVPLSVATGKRSLTLPSLGTQARGAMRGLREGTEEALRGVNTQNLATQFDLPQQRVFGTTPVLSQLETALNLSLRVPDRAFFQAAFDDAMLSGAWVQARNEGLKGTNLGQRVTGLVADPPKGLIQQARADALLRTFQDENIATTLFVGLKKLLNLNKEFGVGDLVLKYPRTPANLLMRAAEYSPLGFIETAGHLGHLAFRKPFNQKGFVESVARATIGTAGLTGTGIVLGAAGLLTGRASKDADVRAQANLQGIGQYRFNVTGFKRWVAGGFDAKEAKLRMGDTWITYDWLQPMSASVAIGAQIALPEKKTPTIGPLGDGGLLSQMQDAAETAIDVLAVGVDTLAQQPLVQGVRRVLGGQSITDSLVNVLKDAPASFTVSLLNQVNQVMDNTVRDTYDPEPVQEALNRVLARVPLLASTLPPSVDVWGADKDRYHQDTNNPFNVFVNPAFVAQYFPRPEAAMLLELQQATGETKQFPRDVPTTITITQEGKSAKYVLSPDQAREYQVLLGQMTRTAFGNLAQNDQFRSATSEKQVEYLAKVLTELNGQAKDELQKRYQEVGRGITPLPAPEPKTPTGRMTLNEKNVVENFKAQELFQVYDAVPKTLLNSSSAYRLAKARVDAAKASGDQQAIYMAEHNPVWLTYQRAVDTQREKMRRENRGNNPLEKALQEWRGLKPLVDPTVRPERPMQPERPERPMRPVGAR